MAMAILILFSTALSQEDSSRAANEALIQEYLQLAIPGPEHELLKKMVGQWDLAIEFWSDPSAASVISAGTADHGLILGDRFLECHSESGMGLAAMEAIIVIGFDRRVKKYTYIGFDTWGTYYITAAGTGDSTGKVLTLSGEDYDPIMLFTQKYDIVITFESDDKFKSELIFKNPELTGGADRFKMIEITYNRKKK